MAASWGDSLFVLQEADRLKCATNVLHQADQACRRLISEGMKTAKGQSWTTLKLNLNFLQLMFNNVYNFYL